MTQLQARDKAGAERQAVNPWPDGADHGRDAEQASVIQNSQVAALAARVQQYSAEPRKQFVAPSAEASRYAAYLDAWRTGWRPWAPSTTDEARGRIYGSLRLTVSVRADGSIADVEIDEPSPHAVLNQAARLSCSWPRRSRPSRPRSRATPTCWSSRAAGTSSTTPWKPSPMTEARYAVIGNPIAHSRSPQIHAMFARQTGRALRYDRLLAPLDGFVAATTAFVAEGGLEPERDGALQAGGLRAGGGQPVRPRQAGRRRQHAVLAQRRLARLQHRRRGPGVGPAAPGPAPGRRPRAAGRRGRRSAAFCSRWRRPAAPASISSTAPPPARSNWPGLARQRGRPASQVTAGTLAEAATPGGWDAVINATASGLADAAPTCPAACMPPARWPTT